MKLSLRVEDDGVVGFGFDDSMMDGEESIDTLRLPRSWSLTRLNDLWQNLPAGKYSGMLDLWLSFSDVSDLRLDFGGDCVAGISISKSHSELLRRRDFCSGASLDVSAFRFTGAFVSISCLLSAVSSVKSFGKIS